MSYEHRCVYIYIHTYICLYVILCMLSVPLLYRNSRSNVGKTKSIFIAHREGITREKEREREKIKTAIFWLVDLSVISISISLSLPFGLPSLSPSSSLSFSTIDILVLQGEKNDSIFFSQVRLQSFTSIF